MQALAHPVFDTQRIFRTVLEAMSRPARPRPFPVFPKSLPEPFSPVLAGIALTLCDGETPVWLSPCLRRDDVLAWLRFQCGCPFVEEPEKATFALVCCPSELPPLSAFAQGLPAYPDRSATVCLAGLTFGQGLSLRASGPGIPDEAAFACTLPGGFAEQWRTNTTAFPLGVDMLLCSADSVAGLPRTTRLDVSNQENASCM